MLSLASFHLPNCLTNVFVFFFILKKSIQDQALILGAGCEIIVATPNRLFDCLERRFVVFNQCHHIILDEADEMISLGFEPQVLRILESMPEVCLFDPTRNLRLTLV